LRVEQYKFDNATIRWDPSIDRPVGQPRDAPYAFDFPYYSVSTETVILPNNGRGFTIDGASFDRTIAGARISREVHIDGGRAIARMTFRRLTREVPAGEMRAAVEPLRGIVDDNAFLRTPEGRATERTEVRNEPSFTPVAPPQEAEQLLLRGAHRLDEHKLDLALADFDQAAALAPRWGNPLGYRAIALVMQRHVAEAETALERARALGAPPEQVTMGEALIHLARGELDDAVAGFTRLLEGNRNFTYARLQRAEAYQRLGRFEAALADFDAILSTESRNFEALSEKARLLAAQNDTERAVSAADELVAAYSDPGIIMIRAEVLQRVGRTEEARTERARALAAFEPMAAQWAPARRAVARGNLLERAGEHERAVAAFGEAISLDPNDAAHLNHRCWARAVGNIQLEEALADCDRALSLQPRSAGYLDSRALVRLQLGRIAEAIADENEALAITPYFAEALFVRGVARIRNGDRRGGETDLALARRLSFDIDARYRQYGVTP
jgi:tetratricopeptide (TPR) repeat protein